MDPFVQFICYLVAFVCFIAAAAGIPSRANLMAAGLAAWVLVPLVITGRAM